MTGWAHEVPSKWGGPCRTLMSTAATPTNAWSGRRPLNPISSEIPFSKWRKRGWRRLYMQTVSHAVAGATLAEHVPMHPDRPTRQKIGRNSDVRRRLLLAEHAANETNGEADRCQHR